MAFSRSYITAHEFWTINKKYSEVNLKKSILILTLACALQTCHDLPPAKSPPSKVSARTFPVDTQKSAELRQQFGGAKSISDILEIKSVLELAETDASVIGRAKQVIPIKDNWFVLDGNSDTVLQFDGDGAFIRVVGVHGRGPGEFGHVLCMARDEQDHIATYDSDSGKVLFFDLDGNFLKEILLFKKIGTGVGSAFFFHEKNLYISEADYGRYPEANHLIVQFEDIPKVLGAFGNRYKHADDIHLTMGYPYFNKFGDRIWVASPFSASLFVYDLDGTFVKKLRTGVDGIEFSDLDNLKDSGEFDSLKSEKAVGLRAFDNGVVLLDYFCNVRSKGMNYAPVSMFDVWGNLICTVPDGHKLVYGMIVGGGDHFTAAVQLNYFLVSALKESLSQRDFQFLLDNGYDPDKQGQDNTWLISLGLRNK